MLPLKGSDYNTAMTEPHQLSVVNLVNGECVSCECSVGCVMRAARLTLSLHMCRAQGISLIPQLSTGFAPHNGVVAAVSDPGSNFCAVRHSGCRRVVYACINTCLPRTYAHVNCFLWVRFDPVLSVAVTFGLYHTHGSHEDT